MEKKLFELFNELLNEKPFLQLEIGYTRTTDWMVHIWDNAGGKKTKIITTQGVSVEVVCFDAYKELLILR